MARSAGGRSALPRAVRANRTTRRRRSGAGAGS
jgi:hypothetical protein